ncbi:hypothetical protein AGR4A_Lc130201 [Agrobacterium tumefaciens str. B6]|uniref:Uncharacterized protein n=1 Tax=Agrobacterium tumefaciens str. B6 TaxID=1183423 RepID=A0A822V552_AGRTU|nr:hypothetical protein AGR4A_Lc130201 [Agrobacterium tumefaciens str. B6]
MADGMQPMLVRYLAGQFHGEAEVIRHRVCPALERRHPVGAIEGGIDLDTVENSGITAEPASRFGKKVGHGPGDGPSSCCNDRHSRPPSWI